MPETINAMLPMRMAFARSSTSHAGAEKSRARLFVFGTIVALVSPYLAHVNPGFPY
jgi:hypothetical protein